MGGEVVQHVKIFKSNINEVSDTNHLESSISSFVKGKTIISLTQTMVEKPKSTEKNTLYFIVITVLYEDGQ